MTSFENTYPIVMNDFCSLLKISFILQNYLLQVIPVRATRLGAFFYFMDTNRGGREVHHAKAQLHSQ